MLRALKRRMLFYFAQMPESHCPCSRSLRSIVGAQLPVTTSENVGKGNSLGFGETQNADGHDDQETAVDQEWYRVVDRALWTMQTSRIKHLHLKVKKFLV